MMGRITLCIFFITSFIICSEQAYSQILTTSDVTSVTGKKKEKWTERAKAIAEDIVEFDKYGELHFTNIGKFPGQTKQQLYEKIVAFLKNSHATSDCVTDINNKEYSVIFRPQITNIAQHSSLESKYIVSISPILKIEFKDEKARFSFILSSYDISKYKEDADGAYGFGTSLGSFYIIGKTVHSDEVWAIRDCYPFVKGKHPRVTCSKALVNTEACYRLLCEKLSKILSIKQENAVDEW